MSSDEESNNGETLSLSQEIKDEYLEQKNQRELALHRRNLNYIAWRLESALMRFCTLVPQVGPENANFLRRIIMQYQNGFAREMVSNRAPLGPIGAF